MKLNGKEFIIIGENVHTTRVVLRKGKLVTNNPDGVESVRYLDAGKKRRYLTIPEDVKNTQDYEEGRVKHVKIAVQAAMNGKGAEASEGLNYVHRLVQRQVDAGADFVDLNVDEISLRPQEQKEAMQWLVRTVEEMCPIPLSVDSSNVETIQAGLESGDRRAGRMLLNSASLERLEALDLAKLHDSLVIVTAAGESGMPQDDAERIANASQMVDAALDRGISIEDIFIDVLIFPISVDSAFGVHAFDTIRQLRAKYGPDIHITGGFSNVSFGLPCRRIVNDAFMCLAIDAGADSGIIDPVTSRPSKVFSIDRGSRAYQLAEDMLLGRDRFCKKFLRAYRKGELEV